MKTRHELEISDQMYANKLGGLINQFYKILPIKESGEPSLKQYMNSLQREMLGLKGLMGALQEDAQYLSLLSILEYLIENECDVATVKSDVFRAISIIKRMQARLTPKDGG